MLSAKRKKLKSVNQKYRLSLLAAAAFLGLFLTTAEGATKATFLYSLSTFTGPVPYSAPRLFVDKERNEISVLYRNGVSIFVFSCYTTRGLYCFCGY